MRQAFRDIVAGWALVSGLDDITDRIERAALWTLVHGPLEPDEQATIQLLIEMQIARSDPRGSEIDSSEFLEGYRAREATDYHAVPPSNPYPSGSPQHDDFAAGVAAAFQGMN